MKLNLKIGYLLFSIILLFSCTNHPEDKSELEAWKSEFKNPPMSSWPGVYWYFMDGNISKTGITKDLEAMKEAGISSVIFLEVNVGVPRGKVKFLSKEWKNLFVHAVNECKRVGIEMVLGVGPGWTGSGGPWVGANESMKHLVASEVTVSNSTDFPFKLPKPKSKRPYFGEGVLTPELKEKRDDYYEDVAVLAFPGRSSDMKKNEDIDQKALYYRAPYTSVKGTSPFIPSVLNYSNLSKNDSIIDPSKIIDLSDHIDENGFIDWTPPTGNWTIMRFGVRNNGAVTRPAPIEGLGFEADKFDTLSIKKHLDEYVGSLLDKMESINSKDGGLKRLHMDSWEMGAQNWTTNFREKFKKRRGYDPQPYFPAYAGFIVGNSELNDRFLWDLRQTSQELILENHAKFIKNYAHKYGLELSIEPYDMNPTSDVELGNIADVIMGEFWSKGFGYNSAFAVIEAVSIAHINGQKLVPAEAFTSSGAEGYKQYPGSIKNQGDWAFAQGVNKLMFHTFQHQPLDDNLKPGMTMGPYGVHWDRNQTWWPMVKSYHEYVSRIQYLLQKGRTSADILYLVPESSPHVFKAPVSALDGDVFMPDRKGYNFDACAPSQLLKAKVENNKVVFPSGASYQILVLPYSPTMTIELLTKIYSLISKGAVVIGLPPKRSPSLTNYPKNDEEIQEIVKEVWGSEEIPDIEEYRSVGKGTLIWGGDIKYSKNDTILYPNYNITTDILSKMDVSLDFQSNGDIRYTHRTSEKYDIYFISNRTSDSVKTDCTFRSVKGSPQLWNPINGEIRQLSLYTKAEKNTTIPMVFCPYESFLIVFEKGVENNKNSNPKNNFPEQEEILCISGTWDVSFDSILGTPKNIEFEKLWDWSKHPNEGIKYFSGIATYVNSFNIKKKIPEKREKTYLDLGIVKEMARVTLNGEEVGVVWSNNQLDITPYLKEGENSIQVEVANLWINRLIGDELYEDDQFDNGDWPKWLKNGEKRPSKREAYITHKYYNKNSQLLESGLIGPVKIFTLK